MALNNSEDNRVASRLFENPLVTPKGVAGAEWESECCGVGVFLSLKIKKFQSFKVLNKNTLSKFQRFKDAKIDIWE